jgi:hypothetical protein
MKFEIETYVLTLTREETKTLKKALYYEIYKSWTQTEDQKKLLKKLFDIIDIDMGSMFEEKSD